MSTLLRLLSRLPRILLLAATVAGSFLALALYGVGYAIIALMLGVTASVLVGRFQAGRFKRGKRGAGPSGWRPKVQHEELPAPSDDPVIAYPEPVVEQFASREPPLAHLNLDGALRTQLDGYALGRCKRVVEAPDLLPHAAADAESWPVVEAAVQKTVAMARSRGVDLNPDGVTRLQKALALSAAQGVLVAEWRQLEDGKTVWDAGSAHVRASDAFTIQRICEAMERQLLPDLFAGIARRPPDLEVRLLLPYALTTAFYLRLQGNPPRAFAA